MADKKVLRIIVLSGILLVFGSCKEDAKKTYRKSSEHPVSVSKDSTKTQSIENVYGIPDSYDQLIQLSVSNKRSDIRQWVYKPKVGSGEKTESALLLGIQYADYVSVLNFGDLELAVDILYKMHSNEEAIGFGEVPEFKFPIPKKKIASYRDSLSSIARTYSNRLNQHLIHSEQEGFFIYFQFGAWLETMHYALIEQKNPLKRVESEQFILEQKVIIENLLQRLISYEQGVAMHYFEDQLLEILNLFDQLNTSVSETIIHKRGKFYLLSGGKKMKADQAFFDVLAAKISKTRESLTNTNFGNDAKNEQ